MHICATAKYIFDLLETTPAKSKLVKYGLTSLNFMLTQPTCSIQLYMNQQYFLFVCLISSIFNLDMGHYK